MARHARRLILCTGAAILALLLLALLVIVVVVLTIDPDRFRARIETAASAAIGRSVQLSGGLHWHLGWRTAIESRGGQIANAPGFGPEPFASWEALRFGVAIRPLLHRELHIDRIEVDGLRLRMQRDATGAGNWKFAPSSAAEQAPAGSKPTELGLRVGSIALRNAALLYQDAVAARDWQFTQIRFDAQLPPDPLAMQLDFSSVGLSGQASGAPFKAPGVAFGLQAGALKFDREAGSVSVPAWKLQWDEAQMEGSAQARTLPSVAAQGRLSLRAPSLRALLASVSFPVPAMRDPAVPGPLRLAARADWHDGAAIIDELEIALDDTKASGRVELPSLSPLALRFQLAADRVDVDRYLEPEDAGGEPFELPLAALKKLDARGALTIREAAMTGATAKELRIDVE